MKTTTKKRSAAADRTSLPPVPGGWRGFFAKFGVLKDARRELWLTFLIKFLIYTAYSITNKTMVLWLSRDLGFSDQAAGALLQRRRAVARPGGGGSGDRSGDGSVAAGGAYPRRR